MIRKDVEAKVVQLGATTRQARNIYSITRRLNIIDLRDKADTSQAYAEDHKSVSASRPDVVLGWDCAAGGMRYPIIEGVK